MTGFLLTAHRSLGQCLMSRLSSWPWLTVGHWKAPVPTTCMTLAPAHGVEAPLGLPHSPVRGWWCTGWAAHRAADLLWG